MEKYDSRRGILFQVLGLWFGIIFSGVALLPVFAVVWDATLNLGDVGGLESFPCLFILAAWGWFIAALLMNYFPTIWVDYKGLYISFNMIRRVFIPLKDITAVERVGWADTRIRVSATKITLLHRLYGYNLFQSAFYIDEGTSNLNELLREIGLRTGYYVD